MSAHHFGDGPELAPGRTDGPGPIPTSPVPPARSRGGMSCGMGGGSMSMMVAVLVGVALGALLFGGGAGLTSVTQVGSWTFLLFLLPCLLMVGAMMMMGGGSDKQKRS